MTVTRVLYRNNSIFTVCISTDLGWYEGTIPELNVRALGDTVKLIDMWLDDRIETLFAEIKGYGRGHGNTSRLHSITAEQEAELIAISEKNRQVRAAKDAEEEIAKLRDIICCAEAQSDIPDKTEVNRRIKEYNDIYNEGGEGYVPRIISRESYNAAKQRLSQLNNRINEDG